MADAFRFGPFTLYAPAGALYKGKTKIRLQQHPATVLQILVERPGELVSREEIRSRVWPNGTVVEFDHSINTAVNRLRAVLADDPEKPRYIETLPRKGYRFIAPVERANELEPMPVRRPPQSPQLAKGAIVSHYRLGELIGEGANGSVYEAEDLTLGRKVALKFLNAHSDGRALERFRREARTISTLDHPNVCSVYEFGDHGGHRFLAMQLLEGETLARRIARSGALPAADCLWIGGEAAAGMQAAHDRGIIHRDLKPENIFVTSQCQVKILDFGLAKLAQASDEGASSREPVTGLPPEASLTGPVAGTVAYMSPEQLRGEELDYRTDIFSFGFVLYEAATGRHPFAGQDPAEALLTRPIPPPSHFQPGIQFGLEKLILEIAAKDRDKRPRSFTEIRHRLEALTAPLEPAAIPSRRRVAIAVAGAMAVLGLFVWFAIARRPEASPNLTITPVTSSPGLKEHVVLSPDDSRIAFAWYSEGDNEDVFVQPLGSHASVRLTSSPSRDFSPAWSPDGRHVAFLRSESNGAGVWVTAADGGAERKVRDLPPNPAPFCRALDWSSDGKHLAVVEWRPPNDGGPGVLLVSLADGAVVRRLVAAKGDFLCAPAFSPDGTELAVMGGPDFRAADVHVVPVTGGAARRVSFDGRMMQGLAWTSDGAGIVYSLRRSGPFGLWQVPVKGGPSRALLETGNDVVDPHLSRRRGRMVFARDMWDTNLWRVEGPEWKGPRAGPVKIVSSTREDTGADVSPDGRMLAFISGRTGAFELWVSGVDGANPRQLTRFNGPDTVYPRWSPDGRRIAFNSYPEGRPVVFVIELEGGEPERRTDGEAPFWSRDGRWIYYLSNAGGGRAIWRIGIGGDGPVKIAPTSAARVLAEPDGGRWFYEEDGQLRLGTETGPGPVLVRGIAHGMWSPSRTGACFLNFAGSSFAADCLHVDSNRLQRAGELGSWPRVYGPPGFAISQDGKWIFYGRVDQLESNIMLAEGPF